MLSDGHDTMRQITNRGSVAVWIAGMLPAMLAAIFLPIEAAQWSHMKIQLQRSADLCARAGMLEYKADLSATPPAICPACLAQDQAGAMARLNQAGVTIEANMVTGLDDPSEPALSVTLTKRVPLLWFAGEAMSISASATAELIGPAPAHGELDNRPVRLV